MREMMFRSATLVSMISLAGCAVNVPHMGDIGTAPQQRILNEIDLLGHIQSELHLAYDHAKDVVEWENEQGRKLDPPAPMEDTSWIDGWGTKINFEIQVEAKSAFTPGCPSRSLCRTLSEPLTMDR